MADGEGFARQVSLENLEKFAPILAKRADANEDEEAGTGAAEAVAAGGQQGDVQAGDPVGVEDKLPDGFFDGERFAVPLGHVPAPRLRRSSTSDAEPEVRGGPSSDHFGSELWVRRNLPVGDAQRPASETTSPHGRITLVQDQYEIDGETINAQRYFREEVFGGVAWEELADGRERAVVRFEVIIHGDSYGVYDLEVMHVPEWEAGQNNFTTEIRWGPLNTLVRTEVDVRGDRLTIYGPPEDEDAPYVLVLERP